VDREGRAASSWMDAAPAFYLTRLAFLKKSAMEPKPDPLELLEPLDELPVRAGAVVASSR
jgi:hypothetical protein